MNGGDIIKVGFCVAYDWELLKVSVPRVYEHADSICFSLDKNRVSWSGKSFEFDTSSFYQWVNEIDKENKIRVLEEDFYVPGLAPLENDNRQRTIMSQFMGRGGWHIQIDSDEYFLDFKAFVDYLLKIHEKPVGDERPLNVCANVIPLIKQTADGFIFVNNPSNSFEDFPFATNCPVYQAARRNGYFNLLSCQFVIHQTWARGEVDLWNKLNSWGHNNDFLSKDSYFNLWKALDRFNYVYIRDFHPIEGKVWRALGYIPADKIETAIDWLRDHGELEVDPYYLFKRNSRVYQSIRQKLKL